jgi:hypothetical protein
VAQAQRGRTGKRQEPRRAFGTRRKGVQPGQGKGGHRGYDLDGWPQLLIHTHVSHLRQFLPEVGNFNDMTLSSRICRLHLAISAVYFAAEAKCNRDTD